ATAHAFLRMQAAADSAGVTLSINSGFRSMDEQRYLYNCYVNGNCNSGNIAARPGYSNHQNGQALDLATSNWAWVRSNAARFGFSATVPQEKWHYEFTGSDPGGPCSGPGGSDTADDDDRDSAPPNGACYSATLARVVSEGSCVQSSADQRFFQCNDGKWYRGV